jgi:ubiquinone/menaquinone biosynthesis C-methylase UbiE
VATHQQANSEQIALWNDTAGRAWVDTQRTLDAVLAPFERLLVAAVAASQAKRVLDVGCGTGSTTLAIARQAGPDGSAVGVDISEPMIELARRRAEREGARPHFICADAQTYAFDESFDMIVSRFGVMFFDDPVRAFANLRRAATRGARLHTIVWRGAADNPFMTTAERAAAPFLPQIPTRKADEPGQFAFADRARVNAILHDAGWSEIDIQPLDVECTLPQSELTEYVTRLGPLGRVLPQLDEQSRKRILAAVLAAFDSYVHGANVRFTAACWIVRARAS